MENCPFIDGSPIKNGMSITRRIEKLINIPWARGWLHPRVSMAHPTANRLDVETPPEKNAIGGRDGSEIPRPQKLVMAIGYSMNNPILGVPKFHHI
jgi:hypothetical protein